MNLVHIQYYKILSFFKIKVSKKNFIKEINTLENNFITLLLETRNKEIYFYLKTIIDKSLNIDIYKICKEKNINYSIHIDITTIFSKFMKNTPNYYQKKDIMTNLIYKNKIFSNNFIKHYGKIYHILIDIDDTLFPAKNIIGGQDKSWFKGKPYPLIKEFIDTLYNRIINNSYLKYSTILSATPLGIIPLKGDIRYTRMQDPHITEILGEKFSFLHGKDNIYNAFKDILNYQDFFKSINKESIALTKKMRFDIYKFIFPEYKYIFLGDNGQGDYEVGKYIIDNSHESIICIHNIFDGFIYKYSDSDIVKKYDYFNRKSFNKLNFLFYKDYLELSYYFYKYLNIFTSNDFSNHVNIFKTYFTNINSLSNESKYIYNYYLSNKKFFCNTENKLIESNNFYTNNMINTKQINKVNKNFNYKYVFIILILIILFMIKY